MTINLHGFNKLICETDSQGSVIHSKRDCLNWLLFISTLSSCLKQWGSNLSEIITSTRKLIFKSSRYDQPFGLLIFLSIKIYHPSFCTTDMFTLAWFWEFDGTCWSFLIFSPPLGSYRYKFCNVKLGFELYCVLRRYYELLLISTSPLIWVFIQVAWHMIRKNFTSGIYFQGSAGTFLKICLMINKQSK